MTIGTIELAEQELVLLEQIDFDWHSHDSRRRSCEAAARLMPLLLGRKAIPERRLSYFDDPKLNGGKKSRLQVFEGNGTVGVDIFEHGNGVRLMSSVYAGFRAISHRYPPSHPPLNARRSEMT